MKTIELIIDNQKVLASEGDPLLWVALENGFYIPNLCALKERSVPFAGCRLCFVEIEGYPEPVTACTETVREGMVEYQNRKGSHASADRFRACSFCASR